MTGVALSNRVRAASQRAAEFSGLLAVACLIALVNISLTLAVPTYARLTGATMLPTELIIANWWLALSLLFVTTCVFSIAGLTTTGLRLRELR